MPELGPQTVRRDARRVLHVTADASAERAHAPRCTALEPARARGISRRAGYIEAARRARAIGNSKGLFGYYPYTTANYTLTVRTRDGTGSGLGRR